MDKYENEQIENLKNIEVVGMYKKIKEREGQKICSQPESIKSKEKNSHH